MVRAVGFEPTLPQGLSLGAVPIRYALMVAPEGVEPSKPSF